MNVVHFPKQETPHITGEAVCSSCGETWQAVAPVGTTALGCLHCGDNTGLFIHEARPKDGSYQWRCKCGSLLFHLLREGPFCIGCGEIADGWYD